MDKGNKAYNFVPQRLPKDVELEPWRSVQPVQLAENLVEPLIVQMWRDEFCWFNQELYFLWQFYSTTSVSDEQFITSEVFSFLNINVTES